jgi:hypothetical protein
VYTLFIIRLAKAEPPQTDSRYDDSLGTTQIIRNEEFQNASRNQRRSKCIFLSDFSMGSRYVKKSSSIHLVFAVFSYYGTSSHVELLLTIVY